MMKEKAFIMLKDDAPSFQSKTEDGRRKYACYTCLSKFFTISDLNDHKLLCRDDEMNEIDYGLGDNEKDSDYCEDESEEEESDTDDDLTESSLNFKTTGVPCSCSDQFSDNLHSNVTKDNIVTKPSSNLNSESSELEKLLSCAIPNNLNPERTENQCSVNDFPIKFGKTIDTNDIPPKSHFECKTCKLAFKTFCDLRSHKSVTTKCVFSCKLCSRLFNTSNVFLVHVMHHRVNFEGFFNCEKCQITFENYFQLKKHELVCQRIKIESTESTSESFESRNINTDIMCSGQEYAVPKVEPESVNDVELATVSTGISCELCYDVCNSEEDFVDHMKFHRQLEKEEEDDVIIIDDDSTEAPIVNTQVNNGIKNPSFNLQISVAACDNKRNEKDTNNSCINVSVFATTKTNDTSVPKKSLLGSYDTFIPILPKPAADNVAVANINNKTNLSAKQVQHDSSSDKIIAVPAYIHDLNITKTVGVKQSLLNFPQNTNSASNITNKDKNRYVVNNIEKNHQIRFISSTDMATNTCKNKTRAKTNSAAETNEKRCGSKAVNKGNQRIAPKEPLLKKSDINSEIPNKFTENTSRVLHNVANDPKGNNGLVVGNVQTLPSTSQSFINTSAGNQSITNNITGNWTNANIVTNPNLVYVVNPVNNSPMLSGISVEPPSSFINEGSNIAYYIVPTNTNEGITNTNNFAAQSSQSTQVNMSFSGQTQYLGQMGQMSTFSMTEQNNMVCTVPSMQPLNVVMPKNNPQLSNNVSMPLVTNSTDNNFYIIANQCNETVVTKKTLFQILPKPGT